MKKLAIITSHPIQYNAPLFRLLTERKHVQLKVFYTWGQTKDGLVYDPDFKKAFKWDIPLLEGYEMEFVENISANPSAGNFKGIQNKDLIERIALFNPDALLVFGWSFKSHLQVLRFFKGRKKILFRGDSTLLDESPTISIKKIARRLALKWVYQHIDYAIYTGEANKAYFIAHGLQNHQLIYAPHAVDNQRFEDLNGAFNVKAKNWRQELNIPPEAIVFLFAGKLEEKKNPRVLIEAFLESNIENAHLIIVGNGVLEDELKMMAKNHQRIHFLDFQNQQMMPIVYQLSDIFVLPSAGPGETWGLSVNEAMASSKAVIVSDRCGCAADLVRENGIVFKAKQKSELMNALLHLQNNPEEIKQMGEQSFRVIQNFTFETIAQQIESVI